MSNGRNRGIAMISVLWVIALLVVMAAAVSADVRNEIRLADNLIASAQARHAAEGGVQLALAALLADAGAGSRPADGSVHELAIGDAIVRVTIIDEAGKIDLNAAPEELLDGLLRAAGLEKEERRNSLDAILDWRDADSEARPKGAEDADYRAAGQPYAAKDAPFDSVEELQLVMGVSSGLYRKISPALTVYSRQAGINPDAASRLVLLAIMDAETVEEQMALRGHDQQTEEPPPEPPVADSQHVVRQSSSTYSIHAQARAQNGVTAHVSATVDLGRRNWGAPFVILNWRPDGDELFSAHPNPLFAS